MIMVMLQKSFNSLSFLFFVPLIFVGAFFLLNLTLAVIKSKFTEEHNARKKRHLRKELSPEEMEKRKEIERIKIQRRIRPFIKKRLFSILEKVRSRLDSEEKTKFKFHRPNSIKGALRRDLFDDHDDGVGTSDVRKKRRDSVRSKVKHIEETKTDPSSFLDNQGLGKMEEESSYEMSSVGHSSGDKHDEESKHGDSNGDSSGDGDYVADRDSASAIVYPTLTVSTSKGNKRPTHLSNVKIGGKNKWRNRLNISRGTIEEVDEEHRSDTTNRMSK